MPNNSEMNDLKPPPDLWIHGNIEISDLDRMSDADSSTTVGRSGGRGYYDKVASGTKQYDIAFILAKISSHLKQGSATQLSV